MRKIINIIVIMLLIMTTLSVLINLNNDKDDIYVTFQDNISIGLSCRDIIF